MSKQSLIDNIEAVIYTNSTGDVDAAEVRSVLVDMVNKLYEPAGTIKDWPGPASTINLPWKLMDGSSYSITQYEDLFNALGGYQSPYGVNVAANTFNIPLVPEGTTFIQNGNTYPLGSKGGESSHLLTASESGMPSKTINLGYNAQSSSGTEGGREGIIPNDKTTLPQVTLTIPATNAASAHNNMSPYMAINKVIKLY